MKSALDFLAGRPCGSPISDGGIAVQGAGKASKRELITPTTPDTAQREVRGFF